LTVG